MLRGASQVPYGTCKLATVVAEPSFAQRGLQVLVIAPEHREALVCLACLWNTVNRPQDATATAKRAVDADPKDAATMELYADCLRCAVLQSALYPRPSICPISA